MKKHTLVIDIAAVGVLVSLLHRGAIQNAWYWSFWWMDVLVHFLAGLLVGLIVLWVLQHFAKKKYSRRTLFTYVLTGVFLVGIGWEVFEYVSGVFVIEEPFPDTFYDLIMDMVGGVTAYMHAVSRR